MATDATAATQDAGQRPAPSLSVVAPAYNETGNLRPLVDEIRTELVAAGYAFEIVLVNDGSSDATGDIIDDLAHDVSEVVGVDLTRNHGQSPALAAGIDTADGDIIVTIDADGQNDPADIPTLAEGVEDGADCVSGHRSSRRDPWGKRLPSWVQTHLAKATGPEINDFGCTLTAYRSGALDDVTLRGEAHRYIPSQLHEAGHCIEEREVNHREREHGQSKYGAGRLLRGSADLLWHWYRSRYGGRPIHLFGAGGALAMGSGLAIGVVSLIQRYVFATPLGPRTPRLILTTLLLITGLQLFVFGVLAEMLTSIEHRQGKTQYQIESIKR